MKLQIEIWVIEKGYNRNICELFHESAICYRNGAYRASLIFTYLGLLTIIKETIIKAQTPPAFLEKEWKNLISKINNDELWEKEVYEALIRTTKPIFLLNEDLKLQLRYWKDRRNDCAHFKHNEIESHHTESFWSFIKSNIPKMTVEGGKETLLSKFDEHFDDSKTPPNSDFTHLVNEIETCVMKEELSDFFKKLKVRVDARRMLYSDSDVLKIYCKILDIANERIQETLIEYLKQENRDLVFLNAFPNKVLQLKYSDVDIRTLWKSRIYESASNINPFNIYSGLLLQNLIPNGEIEEANREIFEHFNHTDFPKLPESKDIETLKANLFFNTVYNISILEKKLSDYRWVNRKCGIIISFIENNTINIETVRCIFEMAESRNPSQWLIKEIKNTFTNIPDIKQQFYTLAKKSDVKIPNEFR